MKYTQAIIMYVSTSNLDSLPRFKAEHVKGAIFQIGR